MTAPRPWRCPRAAPQLGMGAKARCLDQSQPPSAFNPRTARRRVGATSPLAGLTGGTDSAFLSLDAVPEMSARGAAVAPPPRTSGRSMGWSGTNGPLGQVVSSAPATGRGTGGSGHPTNGRGLGRWRSVPFRIVQRPRIGLLPQPLSGVIRAQTGSNARVPASPRRSFLFAVFPAHTRRFQPPSAASPVRRNPVGGRPRP